MFLAFVAFLFVMYKNGLKSRAFTLIELTLVISVMSLLIVSLIIGRSLLQSAQVRKIYDTMNTMRKDMVMFKMEFGYYPGDIPASYLPTTIYPVFSSVVSGNATSWHMPTVEGSGDGIISLTSESYAALWIIDAWKTNQAPVAYSQVSFVPTLTSGQITAVPAGLSTSAEKVGSGIAIIPGSGNLDTSVKTDGVSAIASNPATTFSGGYFPELKVPASGGTVALTSASAAKYAKPMIAALGTVLGAQALTIDQSTKMSSKFKLSVNSNSPYTDDLLFSSYIGFGTAGTTKYCTNLDRSVAAASATQATLIAGNSFATANTTSRIHGCNVFLVINQDS